MEFVLLVKPPSNEWVIWAWAENDRGFLEDEANKLSEQGYETLIFVSWRKI